MKSSKKNKKNNNLKLENDLLLSAEDFASMKKNSSRKDQDLEAYLSFLDDIGAFESKKIKLKFYDAEFELQTDMADLKKQPCGIPQER